jgi:arylsulfatase A-like enzyme
MEMDKVLNTSDLLPTVLNLLGVESPHSYIGRDAFDDRYPGYALFTDGSWFRDGAAYCADTEELLILREGRTVTEEETAEMAELVNQFVYINNLILETDYYKK